MNRGTKTNKYFILLIFLILVSLNSIQTFPNLLGKVENLSIRVNKSDYFNSEISKKINAFNGTDYIISGNTGFVSEPTTVCSSTNQIYILWKEGKNFLKISKYNATLILVTGPEILIDASTLTTEDFELSQPNMLIDSNNNLHIFWYIMGFDTPQLGNIFYLKMNILIILCSLK